MNQVTFPQKNRHILVLLVYIVYIIVLTSIFLLGAEYLCRIKGILPWKIDRLNITVTPGGKLFTQHATLGYTHLPGQFKVRLSDGYSFIVTHRDNTLRITHDLETYTTFPVKQPIWIFGCSFTYGWSLNDQETYPWVLQERLPQYEIVNFGVSGYGTIHALIQFREALTKYPPPKIAIIAYASFHDERNTFLRKRRKSVAPWNSLGPLTQPCATLHGENLEITLADVEYRPFPLMQYSAFIHLLEQKYNKIEYYFYNSHQVTKAIIFEFVKLAKKYGVKLVVAGLKSDATTYDTLEYAKTMNIMTGDISVDLSIKGNKNLPHSGHPSAQANKQYAEKLFDLLDRNGL